MWDFMKKEAQTEIRIQGNVHLTVHGNCAGQRAHRAGGYVQVFSCSLHYSTLYLLHNGKDKSSKFVSIILYSSLLDV